MGQSNTGLSEIQINWPEVRQYRINKGCNMLSLRCPYCGVDAEETELTAGGEAHLVRFGPGSDDTAFTDYLFGRKNPRGVHFERWRHSFGCGKWFHAARCTATLEVFGTYSAQCSEPPADIIAAIKARRPEWEGFK